MKKNSSEEYNASYGEDITINTTTRIEDLSEERQAMVRNAKEDAMMKVASFDGSHQDPYPSPFLNLSDTQIPRTTVEIFRWCKYFYMFDPLISGAVNALATFPVTEVYLEDKNAKDDNDETPTLKTYKRVIFKTLNIHKTLIEIGIDYFLFGNCFVFGEMWDNPVTKEKEWKSMVRLDPSKMIIDYNPATHDKKYKWQVPLRIQEIVRKKAPKDEYNKIPDIIKEAVRKKQAIILNSDNVYHFNRPTDSMGDNSVWGTPIVANVLKLLMYKNVLRQAQEAIAREHIVPMRVYYLDKTDTYNIDADWNNVASSFAQELNKAVRDPNHKVVSPVPVNVINVGGEGRSLLLAPEIQQVQEEILAGMNVPREFIFGGVSYSGSSIALKILENQFITYRLLLKDFLQNFVIRGMAKARKEWVSEDDDDALLTIKMQDLKMQDDVQQKQLIVQLNGAGKVSNEFMWKTLSIDAEKMKDSLEREALAAVELETKVMLAKTTDQLVLQKKQIEVEMELQAYRILMQQKIAEAYPTLYPAGVDPNADPNAGPNASGIDPNAGNAEVLGGNVVARQGGEAIGNKGPTPQIQGVGTTPQIQTPSANQSQAQVKGSPKAQTKGSPQKTNGSNANEVNDDVQKIALQLVKMPDKYRQKVLATLPQSAQQKVTNAISQLESSMKTGKKKQVDMRPMPEQRPPRRDSLK